MVRELAQRDGRRSFVVSQKSEKMRCFWHLHSDVFSLSEAKERKKKGKTLQTLFIFCIISAVAVRGHSMHSGEREKSRKIWLKLAAAEKVFSSSIIRGKIVGKTVEKEKVLHNLSEFNHNKHALFMRSLHACETNSRNFVQSWLEFGEFYMIFYYLKVHWHHRIKL